MPPPVARLKRRSQFLRVAAARRKWAAPGLVLQVRRRQTGEDAGADASTIRVGFTASRKVGNAVARNRVRRRLRVAVGQVMPLHADEGCDFVVIGRRATLKRPFHSLLGDLRTGLKRLGAYREGANEEESRRS